MIRSIWKSFGCRQVGLLHTTLMFVAASVLFSAVDGSKATAFAALVRADAGGLLGESSAPYQHRPLTLKIARTLPVSDTDRSAPDAIDSVEAKRAATISRYPTAEEVFYVMACMQVNGQEAEGLRKCSCAINALEALLPYDNYKDAQLVLAMRQAGGRNAGIFRDTAPMQAIVSDFTRAQEVANRECFGKPPTTQPPAGAVDR
jgi:hypothetical protein